jgi:hypothetical protein
MNMAVELLELNRRIAALVSWKNGSYKFDKMENWWRREKVKNARIHAVRNYMRNTSVYCY